jgi:hypothetical protein
VRSFALLRTNVGLTTNVKIMVSSDYNLSLNSIDSTYELSNSKYKKVSFNKTNYYDELINYFYDGLPVDISYHIKYDNDISSISKEYNDQYDEIYQYGARNIIDNKEYDEEYEYFAPLYVVKNKLPSNFIIFRVDNPGLEENNRTNFKENILSKFKTVKLFDLSKETPLGEWLDINYSYKNEFLPLTPFEMSFDNLEFSKWNGIDYENGGYSSKSMFLEDVYEKEKEIFEFEKFIFDGYKNQKIVFPNILNMSFLFDDTPADGDKLRKWSINRYFGFYLDSKNRSISISPYIPPKLKNNIRIIPGNIIECYVKDYSYLDDEQDSFITNEFGDNLIVFENTDKEMKSSCFPFEDISIDEYFVEYGGNYYEVVKYEEELLNDTVQTVVDNNVITEEYNSTIVTKYKIISDIDLSGKELELNKNSAYIRNKKLMNYDGSYYMIDNFSLSDVWLIEIDGVYHNLIKVTGFEEKDGVSVYTERIELCTDYEFEFYEHYYEYWINKQNPDYTKRVNINNKTKVFNIYRLEFSDIKDFDDKILDTEYSKFEYENKYDLTETDETKIYMTDLKSISNPKNLDDFSFKDEIVNIPVASEYTANHETFKISNNNLTELWRKNSVYCRWGYQNSISDNNVPYLLNNSLIFEDYNRSVNPFNPVPNRIDNNLDYFYTINSSSYNYLHQSLHVEDQSSSGINKNFKFELDKYLNHNYRYDYFTHFFEKNNYFDKYNINVNSKKYSIFNEGDSSIPNITLFKGIKFLIYDVTDIKKNTSNIIDTVNLETTNKFDDYKFSILLSENEWKVKESSKNVGVLEKVFNKSIWYPLEEWQYDKEYKKNSIVIYDDILYISNAVSKPVSPIIEIGGNLVPVSPSNMDEWEYKSNSFFNSPMKTIGDFIYNNGEYYIIDLDTSWKLIEYWKPNINYSNNSYILYLDKIYKNIVDNVVIFEDYLEPDLSSNWELIYSVNYDKNYDYDINDIIMLDGIYYILLYDDTVSKLDNNIDIYINKKWKNILVNIAINDNTIGECVINRVEENLTVNFTSHLSNKNRDDLYKISNSKLTANNVIQCINDLSNKYGFMDHLNYIIVNEDDSLEIYNYDSIEGLPYLIKCETPDGVVMKKDSLIYSEEIIPKSLKPTKILNEVDNTLYNLNYYNNIPISTSIIDNNAEIKPSKNYSGSFNETKDIIYRFSGFYMPIFYEIDLFESPKFKSGNLISRNSRFDTNLTNFGIAKERKIRKINHKNNILKLHDVGDSESIYPMLDEFGYSVMDLYIFKSTWDYRYHYITEINK